MSIASQITALGNNIGAAYNMIGQRGGTIPARKNAENMATAIATIPSGGGSNVGIPREVDNGTYKIPANTSFVIPSDVTTIETGALLSSLRSDIVSLDFNNATTINESGALEMCKSNSSLTSIDISSLTTVSKNGLGQAFSDCINLAGQIDASNISFVGANGMYYTFARTKITSLDLSGLTSIGESSSTAGHFMYMCQGCTLLTSINFSGLTEIKGNVNQTFSYAFDGCTSLTSASFPNLVTLNGARCVDNMFNRCSSLASVDFSKLETIGDADGRSYIFTNVFNNCPNITTVSFPKLKTVRGQYVMNNAFNNCTGLTALSFPALTTSSFGSRNNQFRNMLYGCSNVTVHFPSAIQSTIGNWADVTNGFGGTNTTVLFDL